MAAVTPDKETGFIIDGSRYEVPTLDTFTLDEAQVLYDYSSLTLEDFVPIAEPPRPKEDADATALALYEDLLEERRQEISALEVKLRNPGFLRALVHVAYQRGNPKLSAQRVREAVGASDSTENWVAFLEAGMGEEDAVPPALTTEPEQSSQRATVVKLDTSGPTSEKSSAVPVSLAGVTTIGVSATSSDSDRKTSADSNRAT